MKRGRWKHSIFLLFRRQCDDFFRCVDDKTERRFTQKRLFCGCSFFCVALDKDTRKTIKLLELCFHFRWWAKKNPHTQINNQNLCIWITCFYDFVWRNIFFSRLFHTHSHFFTLNFVIEKEKSNEIGQEKDVQIGNFGHNHMNLLGAKQSITQTTYKFFLDAFFSFFSTGSTMQVANYPDYDMGRGKKI